MSMQCTPHTCTGAYSDVLGLWKKHREGNRQRLRGREANLAHFRIAENYRDKTHPESDGGL